MFTEYILHHIIINNCSNNDHNDGDASRGLLQWAVLSAMLMATSYAGQQGAVDSRITGRAAQGGKQSVCPYRHILLRTVVSSLDCHTA